jgi:hypothetical protein
MRFLRHLHPRFQSDALLILSVPKTLMLFLGAVWYIFCTGSRSHFAAPSAKRSSSQSGAPEIMLRQARREKRSRKYQLPPTSPRTGGPHALTWRHCPCGGARARSGEARMAREGTTVQTHGKGRRRGAGEEGQRHGGDEHREERRQRARVRRSGYVRVLGRQFTGPRMGKLVWPRWS